MLNLTASETFSKVRGRYKQNELSLKAPQNLPDFDQHAQPLLDVLAL
jgi:hypothetical protein